MSMTLHVYQRRSDGTEICLVPEHTVREPRNGDRVLLSNPMRYPPCGCPKHQGQPKEAAQ